MKKMSLILMLASLVVGIIMLFVVIIPNAVQINNANDDVATQYEEAQSTIESVSNSMDDFRQKFEDVREGFGSQFGDFNGIDSFISSVKESVSETDDN